jgi:PAS domain S-box-containing protein
MPAEFTKQFQGLRRVFPLTGGKVRVLAHRRSLYYLGLLLAMLPAGLLLPHLPVSGGATFGAVAETLAANLAMLVGLAALLHYGGTQRPLYAFVGSAFLGAALLDGFHALSAWALTPNAASFPDTVAASGSRWFLPLWLWAGVWAASSEQRIAKLVRETPLAIWASAAGLTLLCLLWVRVLPAGDPSLGVVGHLTSAALYFGAVEALLRRRRWPHDTFEHCLMLSLILGFVLNTMFVSGARHIHDPLFVAALHLKNVSYLLVLTGLAIGMHQLLRQIGGQALALSDANGMLQREIEEHRRAEERFQELSRSLEQRVEERTRELAQAESAALDAQMRAEEAQRLEQETNRQLRAQIEDRIKIERALRESDRRLQLALAAGQIGIWTWDLETGRRTWDERVYLIMGERPEEYSPTEQPGMSRVHPDDLDDLQQALRRTVEQGMDLDFAGRVVWRDGSVRHVVSRATALRDAGGKTTAIVGTLSDVTEHKRGEAELRRQGEELAERVRALRCLYEVTHAVAQSQLPLERICQRVIELLPLLWRDPGHTFARLVVGDQEYRGAGWNGGAAAHTAEIVADGSRAGRIELGFAEGGAGQEESRTQMIQVVDVAVASLGRAIEYRRATERLRRSEQRYRELFDHMISGWALNEVIVDETGKPVDARFLEVNPAFERFVGLRAKEIAARTLREIFWDLDAEEFAKYGRVALSGEPARFECYSRPFDRHLEIAVFSPELGRFAAVFHDVSKRKRAEATLRESQRQLQTLLGNLPGMAYRCKNDRNWTMEFVSNGCEALTGLKPAELLERSYAEFIDPDDQRAVWRQVQRAIEERRPFQMEYRIRTADGGSKWVWEQGAAIFSEHGEVEALEGFISDITIRKQAEEELDRKAKELAASNAELEQFAYAASHDLQEPLRMIAGYTQLLARRYRGKLDSDADEFMRFTIEGTERLQTLIRNLLSYSRVGRGDLTPEPVDLGECARASLENLQAALEENTAKVEIEGLPVVRGQRSQLTQLFQNLIGNAVKYHGEEPPRVRVSAERRGNEWLLRVQDNGIGIDPKFHNQVFELLCRLHSRSEYAGTGIGLAICKKIVENHGGQIWVESKAGDGAAFQFTLPAETGSI